MEITIRQHPAGALAGQIRPPVSILATLRTWIQRARSRRALQELDERLLQDIGVSHAEASRESAKHFWTA